MTNRRHVVMKTLLNRYPLAPTGDAGIHFFPPEDREGLASLAITGSDLASIINEAETAFDQIHYSWVATAFEKLPAHFKELTAGLFSAHAKKRLGIRDAKQNLSGAVTSLFKRELAHKLGVAGRLPIQLLPNSLLTPLLAIGKDKLVELIDLLSMHDLAEEVRQVVDKRKLQFIYSILDNKQTQYLKRCLQVKDRLAASRLEIEKFMNSPKALSEKLHQRGALRLGKALTGQHPDFIWHLTHILDIGRGTILQKYCTENQSTPITSALVDQVTRALNYLKPEGAP